jgi:hypothetical protein
MARLSHSGPGADLAGSTCCRVYLVEGDAGGSDPPLVDGLTLPDGEGVPPFAGFRAAPIKLPLSVQ